jgi:hypothetical protein
MNVAVQYSHKLPRTPERRAGANDLAGFIDAPVMKARKKISRPIIPPITKPHEPLSFFGGSWPATGAHLSCLLDPNYSSFLSRTFSILCSFAFAC